MDWRMIYPLVMLASLAMGLGFSYRRREKLPLNALNRWLIALSGFSGAMIFAKAPYTFFHPDGPLCAQAWLIDGKTILAGIAGGYLSVEIAKWFLGVRVRTGDWFAPPVAFSIAVGRVGCFVAGCCYGAPTELPWGVKFGDGVPRHPTQLYESLFHVACGVGLLVLERAKLLTGQRFKLYVIAYCGYRFVTEMIRPEPRLALGLTIYQFGALFLAAAMIVLWVRDARSHAGKPSTA